MTSSGRDGRVLLVPLAACHQCLRIVAHVLLIEAVLFSTGLPFRGGQKRLRRRHHLVDQRDLTRIILAEFKLGVGDDDATLCGLFSAFIVDKQRLMADLLHDILAHRLAGGLELMFSSWPCSGLVEGVKMGDLILSN